MKKSYNRIVFGPDDTSIGSPEVEVEVEVVPEIEAELPDTSLQDDMDDLFEDAVEEPEVDTPVDEPEVEDEAPEVEIEPEPEIEPEINTEVPVPNDELADAKALILQLQAQVNDLSTPAPIVPPLEAPPTPEISGVNLAELFKDRDVSDLFDTKEGFIGFMQEIVTHTQQATLAQIKQEVPTMVSSTVQSQTSMAEVKNAFYADNADLVPVGQYVARVASSLSEANPTWTVQEVLTQAAVDSRKALGITKPEVPTPTAPKKKTPALPGATSRGKGKPTPTNTLADEMDDLFSDIS